LNIANEYLNECLNEILNNLVIRTESYEKLRSKIKAEILVCFLMILIFTFPAIVQLSYHLMREASILKLGMIIIIALSCAYLAAYLNAFRLHKLLSGLLSKNRYHKFEN
jgi:hypothetical protein